MTEKEKMLSGEPYRDDEELKNGLDRAKDLCLEFNNTKLSYKEKCGELIRKIVGKVGEKVWVTAPFWCDYGSNIELGDYFYSNHNLVILDCGKATFGKNCFVGPNCGFYAVGHSIDSEERNQGVQYAYPITVGDNVWFGGGVNVLSGVTIGSNVVIGAGSLVNKDIPSNVVAAGNPCRVIRPITDDDRMFK
ncbi:MAG: sugar O-acetyltransferase [Clostridiales bacterium]|nr:sugar O-acetyltransferase [Clostridiales bacterium]